jgi:DNA repair exonuclease SbcCD ATPase subunit
MADKDRFRFNLEDDEPEVPSNEEELKRRIAKLGNRLSFVTLLLPCLLAVALYVGYQDLVLRTAKTQGSELRSAERLAAEADQKWAELGARLTDIEAALTARVDAAQKSFQAVQEELRKGESGIDKVVAAKADKKELADATVRIDAALAGVQKDLQALAPFREELGQAAALRAEVTSVSTRLQKLENSLGKDLTGLAGYMDRTKSDLEKIRADLAGLQSRKIDREALDLENLKMKRLYQMALDQEVGRIDKTLGTLQRRLDQLERAFGARSGAAPSLPPLTGGIKEQPVE